MSIRSDVSGELKFSVDSSLLFQLGEQLVAKPSIALAELVKNAYDADATRVTVTMESISEPGGTLLVEDNGHGMTFDEFQAGWMRIATTQKRTEPVSRVFGRPMTGAKGVGRFAARRLGGKLTLTSTAIQPDGSAETLVAVFDWSSTFYEGQDLTEIPVRYSRTPIDPSTAETGVSLCVERMRDSWTEEDIAGLKRDLLSLQSPFPDLLGVDTSLGDSGRIPDPGFTFELIVEGAGELSKLSSSLDESFLSTAWAKLDGEIAGNGTPSYTFQGLQTDELDSLIDKHNVYDGLAGAKFRIYFMVYSSQYFKESEFGVRDAQRKGRADGGVRLFLDGFRVFPYGDPGDDWLQLDAYAARNINIADVLSPDQSVSDLAHSLPGRPFLLIPKNYQLFGAVSISQIGHSGIGINIGRERLIETPVVAGLRRFVQNGIYWMTVKYAAYLAAERSRSKKPEPKSVSTIIGEAKEAVLSQTGMPEEQKYVIVQSLEEAGRQAEIEEVDRINEIAMLRTLASAGTSLSLMNHQLQTLTVGILQAQEDMRRLQPRIPDHLRDQFEDIQCQIIEWHDLVTTQVSQLGFLLSPDSRQRRRRHPLHQIVEAVARPMSYYMKKYGVTFSNNVAPSLRTPPVFQAELYAVLMNLLSNALKFVHGQPVRKVEVDAERRGRMLHIRMLDTGVGIPIERREEVFKPFVSTSIPNPVLGVGTGIGLKVVRDILELYGGTAQFIDADAPWRTCIEVRLPYKDGHNDDQ